MVNDHWAEQIHTVQVVIMGVGDFPIWSMMAMKGDLPVFAGNWALDFVVPHCPPVRGRFVVATQLSNVDGEPIAATRTNKSFGVESGHNAGVLRVDYKIQSTEGAIA